MVSGGNPLTINSSDERFVKVCELLDNHNGQKALDLVNKKLDYTKSKISKSKKVGLRVEDGVVWYDELRVPSILSERLIQFIDAKIDTESFKKFIINLMKNPTKSSRDSLYTFLEKNHVPLTEDGHFIAYKGVSKGFKDKHTGNYDNSVGKVVSMPRNEVDPNINNTCSTGLHVAAWDYAAHTYGGTTIEVKVSPTDVVAVPTDYNAQKMRVCKYKVIAVAKKPYGDSTGIVKTKHVSKRSGRRGGRSKVGKATRATRVKKIEVASRGGASGIIRIPSHLKTIYLNGRNQAVVPIDVLERFGISAKSRVYVTVNTTNNTVEISTDKQDSEHTLTVGNESLLVKSDIIREAITGTTKRPLRKNQKYTISASKGSLVIKA